MSANVDLRQLARRGAAESARPPTRRTPWLTRYVLPAAVLLGFAGVAAWAARDALLPSRVVTVVPVLTSRGAGQRGGAPLFQAAGWVEPRPTPSLATALAEGVVERLLVVEGQGVRAGEPVAQLIDADARLAVRAAEADLRLQQAEHARTLAALEAARAIAVRPTRLEADAAEADALAAQKETDLADLPFLLRTAEIRLRLARRDSDALRESAASGGASEAAARRAASEMENASAAVEQLKARAPLLTKEVEALRAKRDALRERLKSKIDETREVADCEAHCQSADARVAQARAALDAVKLRLERMTVRAPVAGRVLALVARPGMRLMGLAPGSMHDASTVASLYDPASLQIRADVRLEDVPRVQPGQAARIDTPAVPGGLNGEVLALTSQADVQKNTLQVKVAVKAAPDVLRPDMLVRVTFLAPNAAPSPDAAESLRLLIPRRLVEVGDGGAVVWIADQAGGTARRRPVTLGLQDGDLVEVVEGLNAADKLIAGGRDGLTDGARVRVSGEEATESGGTAPSHAPPPRLPGVKGKH
jgi:RND family efflux transporter MFP subunit